MLESISPEVLTEFIISFLNLKVHSKFILQRVYHIATNYENKKNVLL